MSAIAAYRTAILALLSDPTNIIFSSTDVDQALRWALAEYSIKRPLIRTYQFSVEATSAIHVLPADFITRHITRVELYSDDPNLIMELTHYAFQRDEQWILETQFAVDAGEVLQISYSANHIIDGLDGAAGTTVPDADETLLQLGAAGHAALMRALDRIETINMNPDVGKAYRTTAADYLARFAGVLSIYPGASVALPEFPDAGIF